MKSCKAVVECWEAAGKSTRRAYSSKFLRRRRDWEEGQVTPNEVVARFIRRCRIKPPMI